MKSSAITKQLTDHAKWLETAGKQGERANLADSDFRFSALINANLSKAILTRARVAGADLSGTSLVDADLQDADLTDAIGLSSAQLARANLRGAKLPEAIAKFEGLARVQQISKNTAWTFGYLLVASGYTWLTIKTTTDSALLTNSPSSPLPIIETPIPLAWFYLVAPFILVALYIYLHLQLQDLWEEAAQLPLVFPDGKGLFEKAYPWLLSVLIARPNDAGSHAERLGIFLEKWIAVILAWWLAPLTLAILWLRYLPRRDWLGTLVVTGFLGGMVFLAAWSRPTAIIPRGTGGDHSLRWPSMAGALAFLTALIISYGAIRGVNQENEELIDIRDHVPAGWIVTTVPKILEAAQPYLGTHAFARFTGEVHFGNLLPRERSGGAVQNPNETPGQNSGGQAAPNPNETAFRHAGEVAGAPSSIRLKGANLQYARAEGAVLNGMDLEGADLRGADFSYASLDGANLTEAHLEKVYFFEADLFGAILYHADLQGAYLDDANLQETDFRFANLQRAILAGANLEGADLEFAQLQRALLAGAAFKGASLAGAEFQGANLEFATGLTQDQVNQTCVSPTTKLPSGLKPPDVGQGPCDSKPAEKAALREGGGRNLDGTAAAVCTPRLVQCDETPCTIVLKSDSSTCAVSINGIGKTPGEPGGESFSGALLLDHAPHDATLNFSAAKVGRFYTHLPVPPHAPNGTLVVNIPPGDGRSGYFKASFIAPQHFSSVRLKGRGNVDDVGRVFVNGTAVSGTIFCGTCPDRLSEFGNASFSSSDPALFRPGRLNDIVVSDANISGGPSGAAFYVRIEFSP